MTGSGAGVRLAWKLARALVLLVLGSFTLSHLWLGSEWVILDSVNLVFHESGHVLLSGAGDTLHFLGGTIAQLLWPAGLALYFALRQRWAFGSGACAWWFGENLVNVARYMRDAQAQELPLVGGDVHDWNHLFGQWGLLDRARDIAGLTRWTGTVVMVTTLAYLLYLSIRPIEGEGTGDIGAEE